MVHIPMTSTRFTDNILIFAEYINLKETASDLEVGRFPQSKISILNSKTFQGEICHTLEQGAPYSKVVQYKITVCSCKLTEMIRKVDPLKTGHQ